MTELWTYQGPGPGQSSFPCLQANSDTLEMAALLAQLRQKKSELSGLLAQHGALLFRGMPLLSATDFDAFIEAFAWPNFRYADSLSNAVRSNRTERVFTANEAPAAVEIFLHHEMAQTPVYPSKLFFFCETAPDSGGETPLCRSDKLLAMMRQHQPEFVQRCATEGLRYTNVMPLAADAASGQGRSWTSTLGTGDRDQAEQKLAGLGYDWSWLDGGDLKVTTPVLAAVRKLASGSEVFFNQLIAAYQGWNDNRNKGEKSVSFGGGAEISAQDLALTCELAQEITENVAWHRSDVVLLDNFMMMHGRRPFGGSRSILASLIGAQ
ncbi:TauD/TfdA family dioxygenase [Congregibacter variabilis]|uniref:TauD/TfdA family dioxygenase n=1 Tax=Congregibacter variabilis TaxID=3081200 RepID=A0ABZ0I979_9GAMM|nr:TauD/TfdA family dioxygenase [Congregibacter sp. IMCC43200]